VDIFVSFGVRQVDINRGVASLNLTIIDLIVRDIYGRLDTQ